MLYVYLDAIARDLNRGEGAPGDARLIAHYASQIPARNIPANPLNAALVLVHCLEGRTKPFKWMIGGHGLQATPGQWPAANTNNKKKT